MTYRSDTTTRRRTVEPPGWRTAVGTATIFALSLGAMAGLGAPEAAATSAVHRTADDICPVSSGEWRTPLAGAYRITSGFGVRIHPIKGKKARHYGVDLASGPSAVRAAASGTVVRAGHYGGLGNAVEVRHDDGLSTIYGHLASITDGIDRGASVQGGQRLGTEGSTGDSTGVHLHFEVRFKGVAVDPVEFMRQRGVPLDGAPHVAGGSATTQDGAGPTQQRQTASSGRKASLVNKPTPIPNDIRRLYVRAGERYGVPWPLLAGIGMAETNHGRDRNISPAGARGLMQFMPRTWKAMGTDGDGDGRADILNPADSVMSAARYLTRSGVTQGQDGVRRALLAYNHAGWYVADVLYYAQSYGYGAATGADPALRCAPESLAAAGAIAWARTQIGAKHEMGADGPTAWDGSSFVQAAFRKIDLALPRTAEQQRQWFKDGHGQRIQMGQERPGDLIYLDSYRGPRLAGAVRMVVDPGRKQSLAATDSRRGVGYVDYRDVMRRHQLVEIWRPLDTGSPGR